MRKTITIYADFQTDVEKELVRLKKKADKYGTKLVWAYGEPYRKEIRYQIADPASNTIYQMPNKNYWVNAVDLYLESEIIVMNGWKVLAKIEKLDDKHTVVDCFTEVCKPQWYHSDMHCDHCGTNRRRTCVFICKHEDGKEVQVGRSCLRDYTGIDPRAIIEYGSLSWAVISGFFTEYLGDNDDLDIHDGIKYYPVNRIIALAVESIQKKGYKKSSEEESTKGLVSSDILSGKVPNKDSLKTANAIIEWLKGQKINASDNLMRNCLALVNAEFSKIDKIGYLVYLPVAFSKAHERTVDTSSEYIGEVGERLTLEIRDCKCMHVYANVYGYNNVKETYFWRMTTLNNEVVIWKTDKNLAQIAGVEFKMYNEFPVTFSLTGTVKEHSEYKGEKQTVVTRCRVK